MTVAIACCSKQGFQENKGPFAPGILWHLSPGSSRYAHALGLPCAGCSQRFSGGLRSGYWGTTPHTECSGVCFFRLGDLQAETELQLYGPGLASLGFPDAVLQPLFATRVCCVAPADRQGLWGPAPTAYNSPRFTLTLPRGRLNCNRTKDTPTWATADEGNPYPVSEELTASWEGRDHNWHLSVPWIWTTWHQKCRNANQALATASRPAPGPPDGLLSHCSLLLVVLAWCLWPSLRDVFFLSGTFPVSLFAQAELSSG
ncbi:uncharacterized protein LOC128572120 [Nycticebus coucang]|uniref:uncharacterized protein LOC128572120 n=1 Tax=Nycticebus coucang TaxID=9470 RepID=UPI00234CF8A0|nr:uncharacterized protein LOC128572120 [Nycticebus coucang]